MGLRPLGLIAASFTSTFFALERITLSGSFLSTDIYNLFVVLLILSLGVLMLFLSLEGIHSKMIQVKQEEEASLRTRTAQLMVAPPRARGTRSTDLPENRGVAQTASPRSQNFKDSNVAFRNSDGREAAGDNPVSHDNHAGEIYPTSATPVGQTRLGGPGGI